MIAGGPLQEPFFAKLEDVMSRVPAQAIKDQADAIVAQIGTAAMYDTTKMYPTESFVWSLGYVKDWTDGRYEFDPRADRGEARGRDGRCAVSAGRGAIRGGGGLLSLAACGGGGDQPGADRQRCGFRDGEPNGSAGQATVVQPGATFDGCLETSDVEFLMIPSPDDEIGGYVQATVAPAMGTVRVTIYDGAGQAELASFVADAPGAALIVLLGKRRPARRPASRSATMGGGAPYTYELTSNYTPVADPYEPNDAMDSRRADAGRRPDVRVSVRGRHDAANDPAAYDDYYRFTAQPGALSIRLDDVPADLAARLFLFRTDGSEVARVSTGMRGARAGDDPARGDRRGGIHRPRGAVGGGAGGGGRRNRAADELHPAVPPDRVAKPRA